MNSTHPHLRRQPTVPVDLNTDLLGRHLKSMHAPASNKQLAAENEPLTDSVMARIQTRLAQLGLNHNNGTKAPAMLDVMASSINIMQVLITRSRLAGEPADVMVTPLLADLGLMEFHRASIAIEAGRRAVEDILPQLKIRLMDAR